METKRLGDIATLITKGTTPTSIGFDFCEEGINFIKIESITEDGSFLPDKFAHINEDCNQKMFRSQLKENDILFSIAGAIGRTAIVNSEVLPANINQALAIIRIPNGIINYQYLIYLLKSSSVISQTDKQKQGVAQINLSLKNISDIIVPIYSTERQNEIVRSLSKLDHLISLRKQQLAKLDELIKARFVEMFGDPVTNDRKLPTKRLCEICDLQAGEFTAADTIHDFPDDNNKYPCYGGNGIRGYVDNYTQEGEFSIIGRQGALCGNVQFASGRFRNTEHAVLVTPKVIINSVWLFNLLRLENLNRFHTGAAQPGLAVKTLNQVLVPVAELKAQNKYADFYSQIMSSIVVVQKSLDKLETLKKALMQEFFG